MPKQPKIVTLAHPTLHNEHRVEFVLYHDRCVYFRKQYKLVDDREWANDETAMMTRKTANLIARILKLSGWKQV